MACPALLVLSSAHVHRRRRGSPYQHTFKRYLNKRPKASKTLQRTLVRGEESNIASNTIVLLKLTEGLGTLGDQMHAEQNIIGPT